MRVFLSLCILVTTAVALPTSCPPCQCEKSPPCPPSPPPCSKSCEVSIEDECSITCSSTSTTTVIVEAMFETNKAIYPKFIPPCWNIVRFDSVCATHAFQGKWCLTMSSPISCINGLTPDHIGIFNNGFPCSNPRVCFQDTTPDVEIDFNTDYIMTDIAFNLITQRVERTNSLLRPAYPDTTLAIFSVATEGYYSSVIKELEEICDDKLYKYPCDNTYKRDYTIACIGADKEWKQYMVLVICNKYESFFGPTDNYFILVLTRQASPDWTVYEKAFNDIKKSGLSPYLMISIDQSIDLTTIPNLSPEDIEGTVITTTTTTTTTVGKSLEMTDTTISTIDYLTLKPDYKCPYEVITNEYCGPYKILNGLPIETLQDIFNDIWYVQSGTPCLLEEDDTAAYGLLNSGFPCRCLQVDFDNTTPWTYDSPLMMLERGLSAVNGKVTKTRSLIRWAYPKDCKIPALIVYTENCYHKAIPHCTTITPEGIIIESPGPLYVDNYMVYIAGYKPDGYVILHIPHTYTNLFDENGKGGLVYVLTRSRIVCAELIDEINQQLLYCGFNPWHLVNMDQYMEIEEECVFEADYFQYKYSSSCSSVTVESCSSSVTTSCGC